MKKRPLKLEDLPKLTEKIFSEKGRIFQELKLRDRPEQRDYALKLAKAWSADAQIDQSKMTNQARVSIQSAACGVGKTFAYCVVAALYHGITGRRIGIYTNTVDLQCQITQPGGDLERAAMMAARLTGKSPKIGWRLGKQNFASLKAVDDLLAQAPVDRDHPQTHALAAIRNRIEILHDPDRHGYQWTDTLLDAVFDDVTPVPAGFTRADFAAAGNEKNAGYATHAEEAEDADILVMTHARLIVDLLHSRSNDLESFNNRFGFGGLIIDEAELLVRQASSFIKNEVSMFYLWRQTRDLEQGEAIQKGIKSLFRFLTKSIEKQDLNATYNHGSNQIKSITLADPKISEKTRVKLKKHVAGLALNLEEALADKKQIIGEERRALQEALKSLRDFAGSRTFPRAITFSAVRGFPTISSGYVLPTWLFARLYRLDSLIKHVFFTSATLMTHIQPKSHNENRTDIFREFKKNTGVEIALMQTKKPHSDPKKKPFGCQFDEAFCQDIEPKYYGMLHIYAPSGVLPPAIERFNDPDTDEEGYRLTLSHAATIIDLAFNRFQTGQRVLVLTFAKRDNERIRELLARKKYQAAQYKNFKQALLIDEPGLDFKTQKKTYAKKAGSIWITWRAGQGVDLPGLVPNLIIARLPVAPPPDIADIAMLAEAMKNNTDLDQPEEVATKTLNLAAINRSTSVLQQWIGRAIRKVDDVANLFILDSRFPLAAKQLRSYAIADAQRHSAMVDFNRRHKITVKKHWLEAIPTRFRTTYAEKGGAILFNNQGEFTGLKTPGNK